MFSQGYRQKTWSQLDREWDILVIGGGITGAGIFREAARLGLRTLLVEQRDFAWGTSSRSSKLVHGGLRYLKEGKVGLTRASVQERQRLLTEAPGLVNPLGFLLATYKDDHPGKWTYEAGLTLYDLLALQWSHEYYSASDFELLAPRIAQERLEGGFRYGDAQTDDARLVLRVIAEGVADGGVALNYARVDRLRFNDDGEVCGVLLHDVADEDATTVAVDANVVINATGAWADRLRSEVGGATRIRPLRGSHLIFPNWRFPVAQAITFLHPVDRRPVFAFPWEGVTLVGTTDVDHRSELNREPGVSPAEVAYLMAAVAAHFPSLNLTLDDVQATFAGARPVIGAGKVDPSKESREHIVWEEKGLLTVTGGKMTTFRLIALDALDAVRHRLPHMPAFDPDAPFFAEVQVDLPVTLDEGARRRLTGRYGKEAAALVAAIASPDELSAIPGIQTLWAELRWGARAEGVVHLDDLMLRRTRLGLLLPRGGEEILPQVKPICQAELGWDDERWDAEVGGYLDLWRQHYSLPDHSLVPDWRLMLARARQERAVLRAVKQRKQKKATLITVGLLGVAAGLAGYFWWRSRLAIAGHDISAP